MVESSKSQVSRNPFQRLDAVLPLLAKAGGVLLFLLALNFLLPRLLPGDPLTALIGHGGEGEAGLSEEAARHLAAYYMLDQPLWQQALRFARNVFAGDWGHSYYFKLPVWDLVMSHLPWTLALTLSSLALAALLGVLLGLQAAWRRGRWPDQGIAGLLIVLRGIPAFFLGIVLLVIFGYKLDWFPLSGGVTPGSNQTGWLWFKDVLRHLFLPVLTLTLAQLTGLFFTTRNALLEVVQEEYILLARLKGVPEWKIALKHALPNILPPVISVLGLRFGFAAGGAILVETVFAYPGMGRLMQEALEVRDYPLMQGGFLVISLYVLLANLLADELSRRLDPRWLLGREGKP